MAKQYTQEELQHYLDHPEEIDATDEELVSQLAKLDNADLGEEEVGEATGAQKTEGQGDGEAQAKAQADAKAQAEADAKAKAEAAGKPGSEEGARVVTADGRSIPYAVLKDERAGRAAAEAALHEAQQTIIALSERMKAIESGKTDPGAGGEKTGGELREALESVKAEAPWLEEPMAKLIARVEAAEERLADIDQEREETEQQQQARLQRAADAALDANPTLVLWQSKAPELFNEAVAFDTMLRSNPEQLRRYPSFEKRYERVVALVRANHEGEDIPLPVAEPAPSPKPNPGAATPTPSAAEKARAAQALAKAQDEPVLSLTDIPGGVGESSAEEQLDRMSIVDIGDKFMRMNSPQAILDWVMSH